jgi:hypothetical protein
MAETLRGAGAPLDRDVRAGFEHRFGHDFSRIRVHADGAAAEAARSVAAEAFAVGRHVVVAAGRYAPHTEEGRRLLGHELAHTVQQGQAEAPEPSGLRVSEPGDPAEHAADRAASGIGGPGAAPVSVQRQPADPNVGTPPNLGPPVSEVPRPPICSLIFEGGGIYWKCENIPKLGSTPKIPLDPRKIPDEIDKILKKKDGDKKPPVPGPLPSADQPRGPIPYPVEDPARLVQQMCKLYPFICQPAPKPAPGLAAPAGPQLGVLWTDTIHFEQDHPAAGETDAGRVLTAAGKRELQSVLEWLDLSPDLQVRLIGSASSEGTAEYNQALSTRRTRFVAAALAKYGGRIADPMLGDGAASGCQPVGQGLWSCGASKAAPGVQNPEDRVVRVTFARNTLPALPPLTMPEFRPGAF